MITTRRKSEEVSIPESAHGLDNLKVDAVSMLKDNIYDGVNKDTLTSTVKNYIPENNATENIK